MSAPTDQERQAFGDAGATTRSHAPADALAESRVDVIAMIREGIPEREYVPGAAGLLPRRKRVHTAADAKTGKSIAIGVVTAIDVIAQGGTVVILDRENGADEYARRLETVLDARGADEAFRDAVQDRLRYHAWPTLQLAWRDHPDYPTAFAGTDVVIFDSSRSHLTPLGLEEDKSDDFATFTTALIDPLMQAGITTITLDNTGHTEKDRARGTSAKGDLCDIAFTMKVIAPFSSSLAGKLQLRCTASRIGEIAVGDQWHMELGDGSYGSWEHLDRGNEAGSSFRPTRIMEKVSKVVENDQGLSSTAICTAIGGKKENVRLALALLVSEGYIVVSKEGQTHVHTSVSPYREEVEPSTGSTSSPPVPHQFPDPAPATGSTGSPPYGGAGTGPGALNGHGPTNRFPDADRLDLLDAASFEGEVS